MSRLREAVSLVAATLAASVLVGCSAGPGPWTPEHDPDVEPHPDDAGPVSPLDRDAGPRVPTRDASVSFGFDAGRPGVSVPARLSSLVVAEHTPPAISGGTLAVSPTSDIAVAADPDRSAVYLVSVADSQVRTVSFEQGSEPGRVAFDGAGHVHVVLRNTGVLARIDLTSGAVTARTAVCQLPRGLAYDGATDEVLVACASGELVTLAAQTHVEHARSVHERDLRDVIVSKTGERFVSRYRSAELLRVSADGKVVGQTTPLTTRVVRVEPPTGNFMVPSEKREVSMSPTMAWRTVTGADGAPLMLHQRSQDDEVIISQAGGYGGSGNCETITQAGVTQYDAEGRPTQPLMLGGAALVVDVAASPDGRWIALAKPGAYLRGEQGSIEVLSTALTVAAMKPAVDAGIPLGALPPQDAGAALSSRDSALVFPTGAAAPSPISDTAFPGSMGGCNGGATTGHAVQTTAVAFDAAGKLYAFSREPAELHVYDSAPHLKDGLVANLVLDQVISLSATSVRDTGHELFHGDVGTGLACASCHGEALEDGHVWNFRDFGPRRTQNMRGGLLHTLPLHWEGDQATFQHLVDEVMTRRMGGFVVAPKLADALAAWIDKQPAVKLAAADSSAVARGRALFESAETACASCHSGEPLTNSQTVDVGTGGLFQVPSLHGLALRAPFMHDGCAATLADRFNAACGGGDQHGKTSQLSAPEIADLVAYLETL
jgi:mono/diheme cytochrome c family protein